MPARAKSNDSVLRLKITLRGIRPPIWRRLLVPPVTRLSDLHLGIQIAFGWYNSHLHAFDIGGRNYGDPSDVDDVADETRLTLGGVRRSGVKRFTYTYDFGDDWEHIIDIEGTEPREPGKIYPICVAGRRNAPPEDCGGFIGYAEALSVIGDPSHPEYDEYLERLGEAFEPEAFSLDAINTTLAASFGSRRT